MSFPRYPSYKPSGVEWLGDVPAHWGVAGVGYRYEVALGKMLDEKRITGRHLAPYLKNSDVQWDSINLVDLREMDFDEGDRERYSLRIGDLLVCEGGEVGRCAVWDGSLAECYYQKALHRLRPWDPAQDSPLFLRYVLRAASDGGAFASGESKATIAHLPAEALRRYRFPFPPTSEQTDIAAFLDRETAKIDALVAEQERLIELLKEKRQAVISYAVTKGMNPDSPMKPSGVEWLGDVPAHWSILAIKWLSPVKRGASPRPIEDPRYFDDDGEFAWVRILDVSASDGVLRGTEQRLSTLGSSLSVKVGAGDLFVSIAGTVGKPCISAIKACIHDGFVYFPRLRVDPRFMYRIFESGLCYGGLGKWGTQLNLNTDTVGAIRIAVPPPDELALVVAHIDRETAALDLLSREAHSVIALLQTRRSALVSAAVTGQIDVRGLKLG